MFGIFGGNGFLLGISVVAAACLRFVARLEFFAFCEEIFIGIDAVEAELALLLLLLFVLRDFGR